VIEFVVAQLASFEFGELQVQVPDESSRWYALYVRMRFEGVVARSLRRKGYDGFLPLYRPASRWSDDIKRTTLPLFPGYVFCRFNPVDYLPILTLPGVNAIVGFGKNFTAIDDHDLNAIRAVLKSGIHCEPWRFLEVRKPVHIENGPLAGIEGELIRDNPCRLLLSINAIQRSVAVEIEEDWLKPIARQCGSQT
jgi:transcription antitermination factor NusG